ncbi:hypothetical protein BGZ49_001506 [Haplosporangium sp. Z 27]|nr:hypothetical protein BGZ49_001506 [Haplosporangium sp. Z 27]
MNSHDFTGVKEVHESLKLFGKGVKIGIIDSGVDYHHPALGGCFGQGCKVAYGTDFVGDDGNSPDDDPMTECDGHGTHVAGIIAANDTTLLGVAPQATLGAYRVFGCKGGTSNDLIMMALIRAASDGMQIINLSLGGPGGWRQDREARLADALAKNGTIVVAAMGNEGQMGLFESSSPGVAESVITVASMENDFRNNMYFTVDPSGLKNKPKDNKKNGADQSRPILYIGDADMDLVNTTLVQITPGTSGKVKEDACKPITKNLQGKIALIRRGDCVFKVKIANAALANATGVIVMDNVDSSGFTADTEGATIKVRTITLEDGEYLLKTIKNEGKEDEGIKLLEGDGPKKVYNPNGGFLSTFSSMGPDSELNSKPDIVAPGGQIWSTFPVKLGSYASLSGTSMATPYVVGCIALYLEGLPNADRTSSGIKIALQNSGRPRMEQTGFKGYASITQQGAGLLNMMDVLKSQVIVTPSHLSLNDTAHMNANHNITVTNNGKVPVQYSVEILPAAGLLPFDRSMMVEKSPRIVTAEASAKIAQNTITVAPGSSATVDLTFTAPDTDPRKYVIYSGYVRFTPDTVTAEAPVIHVPFMGMKGDYKSVHILDPIFGLRVFDAHGRPLAKKRPSAGHPHVGADSADTVENGVKGDIINNTPIDSSDSITAPPSAGSPESEKLGDIKIVFRMVTGSEALILDLVSDQGHDPYQVESYGVIHDGVARYIPRNDQLEGNAFQVIGWNRQVLNVDGTSEKVVKDANRSYRLRISLLKHFGDLNNDQDFESHLSAPFTLSITISSFKTWKAVVNSTDRNQARRHLFLWFLTLAGLSVEPIADTLLSRKILMYEGFKIIIAGWLLLAHFYLSKPTDEPLIYQQPWQEEKRIMAPPSNREFNSLTSRRPLQRQRHVGQHEEPTATTAATNLDFGRFKRDLERRQSSRSQSIANDHISPSPIISNRQRPHVVDRNDTISASVLSNPFKASSNSPPDVKRELVLQRSASRVSNRAPSPHADRRSSPMIYEFGAESVGRKRPLAATMSDSQIIKSTFKHTPKAQSTEVRRRNTEPRTRSNPEPVKVETAASRMNKRLRQLAEDEHLNKPDKQDTQSHMEVHSISIKQNNSKIEEHPTRSFARPKPPGKNRVAVIPPTSTSNKAHTQAQDNKATGKSISILPAESPVEHDTGLVSASLESRMNHVRDWLKERKPPLLSPPLSARSDDIRETRMPHKRKAYRQLAPNTGPKRVATEERQDLRTRDEDSRIYPQLSDTVAQAPQTQSRPLSGRSKALLSPRLNQQRNSRDISREHDPLRDQPEADPPINWSKFQRPKTVARTSSSLSATAIAAPSTSFTFRRTPTKSTSFIKSLSAEDDDNNHAVSPLIKLRQSQLKQRQQEDYLGIKRDSSAMAEAEANLAFNQALETWEREDDEELARNAAREAAEVEARGQQLRLSQRGSSSSLDFDLEKNDHTKSSSLLDREDSSNAKPTPSLGLLRAIPFNGESSRRPAPDFQPRRSLNNAKNQDRTVVDAGTKKSTSSFLDYRPLGTKAFSASLGGDSTSLINTRDSASLTKRGSYSNIRREDMISPRQRHPGLYTPSKKKPVSDNSFTIDRRSQSQPQPPQTPSAMSRYIQLSNLSDEEDHYD